MNTSMIIAGGMGQRTIGLFNQLGIKVITGAPVQEPEELVKLPALKSGACREAHRSKVI
jgi:predicted Fe-Mo cluster-binding NifX family protein